MLNIKKGGKVILSPEKTRGTDTTIANDEIEAGKNMAEFLKDDIASEREVDQG